MEISLHQHSHTRPATSRAPPRGIEPERRAPRFPSPSPRTAPVAGGPRPTPAGPLRGGFTPSAPMKPPPPGTEKSTATDQWRGALLSTGPGGQTSDALHTPTWAARRVVTSLLLPPTCWKDYALSRRGRLRCRGRASRSDRSGVRSECAAEVLSRVDAGALGLIFFLGAGTLRLSPPSHNEL